VVNDAKQIFVAVVADSRPGDHFEHARKPVVYSLRVTRVLKGKVGDILELPARGALKVGNTIAALDEALLNQKSFWKYMAILALILLAYIFLPSIIRGTLFRPTR
jgi:hypothetical protein